MKKFFGLAVFFAAFAFATAFVGCSNGSDSPVIITVPATPTTDNGGGTTGTDNGGGQTTTPAKYTITFNANDQSENPATDTQTFTAGTPQNLKTIASLGFAKDGCHFAGWLTTADGIESCYADGAAYTATADATLYAKWSAIPVYSANTPVNARGTVTASPATAREGTEITLSASPFAGYAFLSYTVTDADSNVVTVANGKFTMPAKNVTVTATFNAINYCVTVVQPQHGGSVGAVTDTATVGTEVALLASPSTGYEFVSYEVKDADGTDVPVANGKFKMPAKNVTVTATFKAVNFTVTFNANDGSQSSVTASQTFTAEIPQALKTIAELGFAKDGCSFAGWAASPDADHALYADGAIYAGVATANLYALWSVIPVYSASAAPCQNGSVNATPATATAGTEITLSATPSAGYKLDSYAVACEGGGTVVVSNGKFTMPDKNVTVTATFSAIDYSVSVPLPQYGSAAANKTTAHVNDEITLTATPSAGYEFASYTVTDAGGTAVPVANGKFKMPASNVTVAATFKAISYSVNVVTVANGSVTANKTSACVGDEITLGASANEGYEFVSYTVTDAGSNIVSVANGKFNMPAKDVTVTANFSPINYTVTCGTFLNGQVTANKTTATIGTTVKLTISPDSVYALKTLTVTAADNSVVTTSGTGNTRTFIMPAQNVTVTATFAVIASKASGEYVNLSAQTGGTAGKEWPYVTFGLWPQTIKAPDSEVTVDSSVTETHGTFTYCKGSDGEWYVEQAEKANDSDYKYSNGTTVEQSSANSKKWFKVEPIKWRVLATNYDHDQNSSTAGAKLLLAENILIGRSYAKTSNNYKDSKIRAWLIGDFYNSAFTSEQQSAILVTTVDNSARSTNPEANATQWNGGNNAYACDNTCDKVFLLSKKEVTTGRYGFAAYYVSDAVSARIRMTTDFAKASGAYRNSIVDYGGWWWLRSPYYDDDLNACYVRSGGSTDNNYSVKLISGGVVPALCVANNSSAGEVSIPATYAITVGSFANGTVTSSSTAVTAGTTVTLTANPNSGYKLSKLTVKDADGGSVATSGTENTRTFKMPAKNVTVSATFSTKTPASGEYKNTGTVKINSTTYDLVTFGLWPQTIIADDVTVDENVTETHGKFKYCKGSDGEWYVKLPETGKGISKYSNGTDVGKNQESSKWFKVEPINWRVLSTNYNGNKLLFAENVLFCKRYNFTKDTNNYKDSEIRTWLNKDFYNSAFTSKQQSAILETTVDNSERSTNPSSSAKRWNDGANKYACDNTRDKIFLLSEKEVTTSSYGFAAYNKYVGDPSGTTNSTRIRMTTDFAKASGVWQSTAEGMGGRWWLRSPDFQYYFRAQIIEENGNADGNAGDDVGHFCSVGDDYFGVVPALCLEN